MRTPEPATAATGTFNVPANIGNVGGASYRGSITIDVRAVLINNVACFKVIRTAVHKNLRLACDKTFEKRSSRWIYPPVAAMITAMAMVKARHRAPRRKFAIRARGQSKNGMQSGQP